MISTITYTDKSDINSNSSVPADNKVQAEDMNEIKTVVNNNALILGGLNGHILWANANPTVSFTAQTINVNDSSYDTLLWIFKRKTDIDQLDTIITLKEYGCLMTSVIPGGETVRRAITYSAGTTYNVSYVTIGASTQDDEWLIPMYVIGYKTGLY